MNILIAGATGLIGQALLPSLIRQGHHIIELTRDANRARQHLHDLNDRITVCDYKNGWETNNIDVVINLAGSPITRSWTPKQRRRIVNSRLLSTDYIYIRCLQNKIKPKLWLTISATGYYHDESGRELTEKDISSNGGFLFDTCEKIEKNAIKINNIVERHCILRMGIVLDRNHGILNKMLPLYRYHLGGTIGNGRQYIPWIHIQDVVGVINFLIEHQECSGTYNVTAPHPQQQKDLSKTVSQLLSKSNFLHFPSALVRLFAGRQSELLLNNQNVIPARLLEEGYQFSFSDPETALADLIKSDN